MSRERLFGAMLALGAAVTLQVVIDARTWAQWKQPVQRSHLAPVTTTLQTANDPTPIFQCTGAGGGVVVSLGKDGKSIFLECP